MSAATLHKNPRLTPVWGKTDNKRAVDHGPLVDGCIAQNRVSQERVYELFYGKMMGVCLRYTKNMDQAKDILQDGFIKVFKNIEQYNRSGSLEGWIRRIMVNTAIDYFRRAKNSYLLLGEDQRIEDFADSRQEIDEDDEIKLKPADVINAMQKLSPAYRTVFNLYIFEEHTHNEIAEMLNISVGTSKSNLAKAKQNLKAILKKERKFR